MSTAKRRKLKKAVIGWVCIAAMAANMTMPGAPLHEFTQITANAEVPADFNAEATVNLSDIANYQNTGNGITVTLKNGYYNNYYEIKIERDGKYVFTGSNLINDAYVDVQIALADNVTADIYFDDVYIKNDDGYIYSSGTIESTTIFGNIDPLSIPDTSTANVSGKLCIDTLSGEEGIYGDFFIDSGYKTGGGTLSQELLTVKYMNESGTQFEEVYCTSGADAKLPGYECFTSSTDNITENKEITARTTHAYENEATYGKCTNCHKYKPETIPSGYEDAEVVNLSMITDSEIMYDGITVTLMNSYFNNHYEIKIEHDGKYVFTGSNLINDAYADVQIALADNVTADIYFDDVYIKNDDGYVFRSGNNSIYGYIEPLSIPDNSTANVSGTLCIDTFSAAEDTFMVSGYKTGGGILSPDLLTVKYMNESGSQFEEVYCTNGTDITLPAGYECFSVDGNAFDGKNVTDNVNVTANERHSGTDVLCTGTCTVCGETYTAYEHKFDSEHKCTVCGAIQINETTFPDANFRKFVLETFDTDNDKALSASEIEAVTEIDCSNKSISSLEGIRYFTALKKLNCSGNDVRKIDVTFLNLTSLNVSKCTSLINLYCNNNKLTSLDLTDCTHLYELYCYNNKLTSLDLTGCTQLYMLYCYNNKLTSLDLTGYSNTEMNINFSDNTFDIGGVNGEYDLKALIESNGGSIDKVSNVTGATLTNGKLTDLNEASGTITYDYNTGKGNMTVTLTYFCQHDFSSGGVCTSCDMLENGKDGFKSVSVTLTDGVILNYYMLLSDDALADKNAYIHFTSPQGIDVKTPLSDGVENNGTYKFSLKLRPDQMADLITAQVVYSDGSKGNSVDYSVTKYADNVKEDTDTTTSDLIDAMLYYGAATQNYTGNNTDNPANGNVDTIFDSNVQISDDYKMSLTGTVNGIKVKGARLIADSLTTIKVKYQVTEGSIDDFTFTCDGTELTPVKQGDFYYVYIRDISPDNIDKMYNIVVTDKNGNSRTLVYSALTYAKSIIEDTTGKYPESLVNMMKALYYYNKAADAYSN